MKTDIRILDLMEYLNRCGGEARVTDVVRALSVPQSSASRLLHSLSQAGYLSYDRFGRVYRSSARSALLCANTTNRVFGRSDPFRMMEEIRRISRQNLIMTSRNQAELIIIHIDREDGTPEPCFSVGDVSALVGSASGKVMLSRSTDAFISGLVRRHNAEVCSTDQRVQPTAVLETVGIVRENGYLIHPVEAAKKTIGVTCRCIGKADCPVVCCMSRKRAHLVASVLQSNGNDVAVAVGIPDGVEEVHQAEFAADVQNVIRQHMAAF